MSEKNNMKVAFPFIWLQIQCVGIAIGNLLTFSDLHTPTTNPEREYIEKLDHKVREILLDSLSVGIDPERLVIYLQSAEFCGS